MNWYFVVIQFENNQNSLRDVTLPESYVNIICKIRSINVKAFERISIIIHNFVAIIIWYKEVFGGSQT